VPALLTLLADLFCLVAGIAILVTQVRVRVRDRG